MNLLMRTVKPIFSVALKDLRITLRYKTWFFASFLWPIMYPFTFIFFGKGLAGTQDQGLSHFTALAQTNDYAAFLIIGNLIWMFVNINLWHGGLSLRNDRIRGIFDTQMTMPVSKVSLVLGAALASVISNFIPMIVSFSFYSYIGFINLEGNIFIIILIVLSIMPFLIGFLLIFSALTMRVRDAGMIVQVMRTLFSLLCGLQFPLAVLPQFAQNIGKYIPLTALVRMLRQTTIYGTPLTEQGSDLVFILLSGTLILILGIIIFEMIKRQVRLKGLISGY